MLRHLQRCYRIPFKQYLWIQSQCDRHRLFRHFAYYDIVCPVVDACVELDCSWCLDNATMEHITPGICSSCMVSELSYGDADGIKCKSMSLSIAHSDTIYR